MFSRSRSRSGCRRPTTATAVEEEYDREYEPQEHQTMAFSLIDAFDDYDRVALAALTSAQRAEQLHARRALHEHVDALGGCEEPRSEPDTPAGVERRRRGLRDFTDALFAWAMQAQADTGDED